MAVRTIEWKHDRVIMLDQRMLPHKEIYRGCRNYQQVAQAIRDMVIRGAPAIGVAAAMGLALGASKTREKRFDREFERICLTLSKTRPTAVNLFWALERMRRVYTENRSRGVETVKRLLKEEAQKIYKDDIVANKQLGKFGASLLRNARQVMTHCNAGALATAGYGTALGVKGVRKISRSVDQRDATFSSRRASDGVGAQERKNCCHASHGQYGGLLDAKGSGRRRGGRLRSRGGERRCGQ